MAHRIAIQVISKSALWVVATIVIATSSIGCKTFGGIFFANYGDYRHLEHAEEYLRNEQFQNAIREYEAHLNYRLSKTDRPDWENPYFYKLLIGDIELRQGKVDDALRNYELAEENGVETSLVSDRYRGVAYWYESKGKLVDAISILTTYRARDPMLFDAVADRLAKELVKREDQNVK